MEKLELIKSIAVKNEIKILLVVCDGLGGLTNPKTGKSELETAKTPNLDELAKNSACGLTIPVGYGITPGSGPAHLSLFGYDPVKYRIGRGILEAVGINMELTKDDLAARANFCTLDYANGIVTDRRAGRIPTEKNIELVKLLSDKIKQIDDVKVTIRSGKGHRFVVVFTGKGLECNITENDPQKEGNPLHKIAAMTPDSEKTAKIVNKFLEELTKVIGKEHPANYALMRGFSKYPDIPHMQDVFKLNPAAIATYPMYKGLAQLVGMKILKTGEKVTDEIATLKAEHNNYDFFYFHIKATDALGEDGNFDGKVKMLEEIDGYIPEFVKLNPDVLILTGDHSTPAEIKGHSWHPVPFLLHSKYTYGHEVQGFNENECRKGSLGIFHATDAMPLALANAMKLEKFGA